MTLHLLIGGYWIRIESSGAEVSSTWPWPSYRSFLTSVQGGADLQVSVHVVDQVPEVARGHLLYDAQEGLWRLYEQGSSFLFESHDTLTHGIRCQAEISEDFSSLRVRLLGDRDGSRLTWQPGHLFNPLLQVCLVSKLGRDGGFFLHASGVSTEQGVFVFTGDSGAGKSTIAGWFHDRGYPILNDERLVIRPAGDRLLVWGTPWAGSLGEGHNRQGRLARLHCIRHGSGSHIMASLSTEMLSRLVLRQCFYPHWDPVALAGLLTGIQRLVTEIACVELASLKQPDLVDFLLCEPEPALGVG